MVRSLVDPAHQHVPARGKRQRACRRHQFLDMHEIPRPGAFGLLDYRVELGERLLPWLRRPAQARANA
jgi:hypothetical protein